MFRPIIVVHFEGVETHFGHGETDIKVVENHVVGLCATGNVLTGVVGGIRI